MFTEENLQQHRQHIINNLRGNQLPAALGELNKQQLQQPIINN